jgi:hypothetical protein
MDHLLYILLCKVIHYYSVKAGREFIGIEGPNLETKKRKAILERSRDITVDNITELEQEGDGPPRYLVKSSSIPDHFYEVDILVYHCTCRDFPAIKFCKHISAVQRIFPSSDDATHAGLEDLAMDIEPLHSPLPLSLDDLALTASYTGYTPDSRPISTSDRTPNLDCLRVIEKLEILAACMRRNGSSIIDGDDELEGLIDRKLTVFQDGRGLLPTAKRLSPHLNSWPETQAVMMPAQKTRKKRIGDGYGAGEQSGKKAKKDAVIEGPIRTATYDLSNVFFSLFVF